MKLERIRALRGPNRWTERTALEVHITVDEQDLRPTELRDLEARLCERLPSLTPTSGSAYAGPLTLPRLVEVVTMTLLTDAGCDVTFSRTVRVGIRWKDWNT